ncbi:hypothetical protein [Lysobacter enzymogenes]|uniref:Uncharacterized protein n=1 Tax=Lysobacter enzymogenes TaxID=69 RepID=A0AAU9AM40_LYSEN|nr:hypothetical protein [Lysobacter enzymogenes]BAV99449.1 hypothetical protein LEN_3962 [Lysobacter enzymogenes]SDW71305.1 hypothetical protein SAMN05421681_102620 [Lysobacter enzymogenes]
MGKAARALKAWVLKSLRAVAPASERERGEQARGEGDGRAPVYVPAKRGAPTRRGSGNGEPRR